MGATSSRQNKLINAAIELQNKKDHAQKSREIKMLLLGAGESGKSTLFKQVRRLFGKSYTEEEMKAFVPVVHSNIFLNMILLLEWALKNEDYGALKVDVEDFLSSYDRHSVLTKEAAQRVTTLFNLPSTQEAWEKRNEFQVLDSLDHFVDSITRISEPDYIPTTLDHLYGRVRSTGIGEEPFIVKGIKFRLIDVGGQRSERKKWIYHFADVTAVVYLLAISEFDEMLYEDIRVERVAEAMALFKDTLSVETFADIPFIVFFNKTDVLNRKLKTKRLSDYYDDYEGPDFDSDGISQDEVEISGATYMKEKFLSVNDDDHAIHSYFTNATDSEVIEKVIDAVKDIVLKNALAGHIFA